jgi:hypothetical protein
MCLKLRHPRSGHPWLLISNEAHPPMQRAASRVHRRISSPITAQCSKYEVASVSSRAEAIVRPRRGDDLIANLSELRPQITAPSVLLRAWHQVGPSTYLQPLGRIQLTSHQSSLHHDLFLSILSFPMQKVQELWTPNLLQRLSNSLNSSCQRKGHFFQGFHHMHSVLRTGLGAGADHGSA